MQISERTIETIKEIADDVFWLYSFDDRDCDDVALDIPEGAVEYLSADMLTMDQCPVEFEQMHGESIEEVGSIVDAIISKAVSECTDGRFDDIEDLYDSMHTDEIAKEFPRFKEFSYWVNGLGPGRTRGGIDRNAGREFANAAVLVAAGYCGVCEFDIPEEFYPFFEGCGRVEMPVFHPIGYVSYGCQFITTFRNEDGNELGGDE